MQKKISVVIPTYQRANLLLKCLDKLAQQSMPYATYEVIVVLLGPDPLSAERLANWQCRHQMDLRLLQVEARGIDAVHNLGHERARSPFVTFISDDSRPDRNWLGRLLSQHHQPQYARLQAATPQTRTA